MTNSKISKQMVSCGTQFTSHDIFYQDSQLKNNSQSVNVQNSYEKDSGQQLSIEQPYISSSASKLSKQRKKSYNHNFQKHTVVTIKKLMKIKYDANASDEEKLAHKIWKFFMVNDDKSKKLLVILFGVANFSDERNRRLFLKCGFQEILAQQELLVKKAQQILRKRFVQTVTEQVVRSNIQNFRNIKMREEFIVYFSEILDLIRKGAFVKLRINSKTAKKIQTRIQNSKASKQTLDYFQEL